MKYRILLLLIALSPLISCDTSINPLEAAQERYPMLKPCTPEGLKEQILSGTIEVFEDQINKAGKKIPLNVFLFPSYQTDPINSVFVDYAGGPGVPNNLFVPYYEKEGFSSSFREIRDVLIIDKRGTGASAITCDAMETIPLPLEYYFYDTDLVTDCLNEIQDKVDLSNYNTTAQVEDLEVVRKWLGIEKYDFHGISYGTRIGLELIRKYPDVVNSAILTGAVPPDFGITQFVDLEIERVLKKLISRCQTDTICDSHFPNFKNQLYGLRKGLKDSPVLYTYLDNESKKQYEIHFTDSVFLGMVANMVSFGTRLERLPLIIDEVASGNFSPLIEANLSSLQLALPLHLSQFCPEESNRYPIQNLEDLDTLFTKGFAALTTEVKGCKVWQQLPSPDWLSKSIGGNTPLLLFSGEDDVLTPPRMNASVHKLFPNSLHVVFKNQGHTYTDWSCWDNLVYQFLENNGDIHQLDTTCIGTIKRPKFFIN